MTDQHALVLLREAGVYRLQLLAKVHHIKFPVPATRNQQIHGIAIPCQLCACKLVVVLVLDGEAR